MCHHTNRNPSVPWNDPSFSKLCWHDMTWPTLSPCGCRTAWRWRTHRWCRPSSLRRSWCHTLCCCQSWAPGHPGINVTTQVSSVKCQVSCVMCHVSCVKCQVSSPRHRQSGPGAWRGRAWCRAWCRCWRRCRWWWGLGPGHWAAPSIDHTTWTGDTYHHHHVIIISADISHTHHHHLYWHVSSLTLIIITITITITISADISPVANAHSGGGTRGRSLGSLKFNEVSSSWWLQPCQTNSMQYLGRLETCKLKVWSLTWCAAVCHGVVLAAADGVGVAGLLGPGRGRGGGGTRLDGAGHVAQAIQASGEA